MLVVVSQSMQLQNPGSRTMPCPATILSLSLSPPTTMMIFMMCHTPTKPRQRSKMLAIDSVHSQPMTRQVQYQYHEYLWCQNHQEEQVHRKEFPSQFHAALCLLRGDYQPPTEKLHHLQPLYLLQRQQEPTFKLHLHLQLLPRTTSPGPGGSRTMSLGPRCSNQQAATRWWQQQMLVLLPPSRLPNLRLKFLHHLCLAPQLLVRALLLI